MKFEIEHKYLVRKDLWDSVAKPSGILIKQGYLTDSSDNTIRVRVKGDKGFLTIKSPTKDASRMEFEYPIPVQDVEEMIRHLTHKPIIKTRYEIRFAGNLWEVDEFLGDNEGLLLTEIELREKTQYYEKPPWVDKEVTEDARYYNSYLARNPYKFW